LSTYARSAGLKVANLGDSWAVFCSRSGDTVQLNNEAAVVLEVLGESVLDERSVAAQIAEAAGVDVEQVAVQLSELWPQLLALGFVDERD
jgi:PqqD family protein of HPr-rel-A system